MFLFLFFSKKIIFVVKLFCNTFMKRKNPFLNLWRQTWRYSIDNRKKVVAFVIFSSLGNIIALMQPVVIGRLFNIVQFDRSENILRLIFIYVLIFVALNMISWIFHGLSRVWENENAFLVKKNYRVAMFGRVMELPTAWHKDHHSGDTIDKINKASDKLYAFSSETFILIQNFVGLILSIIVLIYYDYFSLVLVAISSVVVIYLIYIMDKRLVKYYDEMNAGDNFIAAGVYDYISNYITLISLRLKKQATGEIEHRSMLPFGVSMKSYKLNELKWFFASLIVDIMVGSVLFLSAYTSYRKTGLIVLGSLFVLYQYLNQIGRSFYTFAWKYSEIVQQNAAIEYAESINLEYEKLRLQEKYTLPEKWQDIQVKQLCFKYKNDGDDTKKCTLENISFNIGRGQRIALIGSSGSGKSTILSLLRGLHQVKSAKVFCDGKKLPKGLKHLEDYCTLIPQEPEIFNNTIEYNINLGVPIEHKEMQNAIRLACLDTLIKRLPHGLKTNVLEKGVSLSGGEKQRLALARGILAASSSQILLLDEPTSSVDVENEVKIYHNIFGAFPDKTIISAIHSLHLLRNFDYVYLFKDSRLVAEGNFTTLLNDENFKVLWESYTQEEGSRK